MYFAHHCINVITPPSSSDHIQTNFQSKKWILVQKRLARCISNTSHSLKWTGMLMWLASADSVQEHKGGTVLNYTCTINKHHVGTIPWAVVPEKLPTDYGGVSILFACHVASQRHICMKKHWRDAESGWNTQAHYNKSWDEVLTKMHKLEILDKRLLLNEDHCLADSDICFTV